jgi:L,D-transpeptidase-like protein
VPLIQTEQLVAALERLQPSDREVLDLSLRRRVPDDALAEVLGCEASEVPRRRAAAIDRLAEELGVQRGEDLGHMLKALLEPETWAALGETAADEPAEVRPPEGDVVAFAGPGRSAPEPEPAPAGEPEPAGASLEPGVPETQTAVPVGPLPGNGSGASTPVLEMLSGADPQPERSGSRAAVWIIGGVLGAAALIVGGGFAGDKLLSGSDDESPGGGSSDLPTQHFKPKSGGPLAAPFPSDPSSVRAGYLTATLRKPTVLYRRPGGPRKVKISARTEWRSPRVLSVVEQRGSWLAVLASELKNGEVGWLRQGDAKLGSVRWSLHADLSQRALYIRFDGRTVRKLTIAVGRPANPTPSGRFAVTDRLDVVAQNSPYGCCVLALTGHQQKLPAGWPGGDRLAVHATSDLSSIGKPVSLGCMRAPSRQARWLIEKIPLGAPIFIHA